MIFNIYFVYYFGIFSFLNTSFFILNNDSEGHASGFVMKWDENFPVLEIDDLQPVSFTVYPNPVQDYLNINTANKDEYTINVYDISGKKLYSTQGSELVQISLENYGSGVYILELRNKSFIKTVKVVKE